PAGELSTTAAGDLRGDLVKGGLDRARAALRAIGEHREREQPAIRADREPSEGIHSGEGPGLGTHRARGTGPVVQCARVAGDRKPGDDVAQLWMIGRGCEHEYLREQVRARPVVVREAASVDHNKSVDGQPKLRQHVESGSPGAGEARRLPTSDRDLPG